MIDWLIRLIKRIAILIPGIIVTYFGVHDLLPQLDKWLPKTFAILVLYAAVAYIFIPFAVRIYHLFFPPHHIPLYCTTPDGLACDPINIGISATRSELCAVMKKAGWYRAEPKTLKTMFKFGVAMLFSHPYPDAPFSTLFLFGRGQDLGFELPIGNNPRHRHHVRFWGVVDTDDPQYRQHILFWRKHHRSPKQGRLLWVGAASLDLGIGVIRHNAQFTHRIHHDTNAERQFLVKQLQKTKMVKKTRTVSVGKPYKLSNRVLNNYMLADGKMIICEI